MKKAETKLDSEAGGEAGNAGPAAAEAANADKAVLASVATIKNNLKTIDDLVDEYNKLDEVLGILNAIDMNTDGIKTKLNGVEKRINNILSEKSKREIQEENQ